MWRSPWHGTTSTSRLRQTAIMRSTKTIVSGCHLLRTGNTLGTFRAAPLLSRKPRNVTPRPMAVLPARRRATHRSRAPPTETTTERPAIRATTPRRSLRTSESLASIRSRSPKASRPLSPLSRPDLKVQVYQPPKRTRLDSPNALFSDSLPESFQVVLPILPGSFYCFPASRSITSAHTGWDRPALEEFDGPRCSNLACIRTPAFHPHRILVAVGQV